MRKPKIKFTYSYMNFVSRRSVQTHRNRQRISSPRYIEGEDVLCCKKLSSRSFRTRRYPAARSRRVYRNKSNIIYLFMTFEMVFFLPSFPPPHAPLAYIISTIHHTSMAQPIPVSAFLYSSRQYRRVGTVP